MCYEERYYSEWASRVARQREATKPPTEQRRPEAPTKPEPKPIAEPVTEPELETG
jgi:hypothetical protein